MDRSTLLEQLYLEHKLKTQDEFNEKIVNILAALADRLNLTRSEPKHEIVGDSIRDAIFDLRIEFERRRSGVYHDPDMMRKDEV